MFAGRKRWGRQMGTIGSMVAMTPFQVSAEQAETALLFNVSTLLLEPLGSQRQHELRQAPFRYGEGTTAVSGDLLFLRTDESIMVRAGLSVAVPEQCSRCLEPYQVVLSLQFEEEFWPEADPRSGGAPGVPEEREGFPILEGQLDLREAVRQSVEMARPMRPHCGDSCPGPAAAGPAEEAGAARLDGRWAVLRTLQEQFRSQ